MPAYGLSSAEGNEWPVSRNDPLDTTIIHTVFLKIILHGGHADRHIVH
jgi:hypothetical protein